MKVEIQDIVYDIRQTHGFQEKIDCFLKSALQKVFNICSDECLEHSLSYNDLLKIASIFSLSSKAEDKKLAYLISIYLWIVYRYDMPEILEPISVILSRLSNFPALNYLDVKKENNFGKNIFLKLEMLGKTAFNSVDFLENKVLTDFQKELWDYLESNSSISFSAPTSAGKSFILKQYIVKKVISSNEVKILYLLPTRALINEAITDLREYIRQHNIKEDIVITSIPTNKTTVKKIIYVLTQERADVLINTDKEVNFDLVVVDEAQQISSSQRGIILQDVVSDIITHDKKVPVVFSCPFIKNTNFFNSLFDKNFYSIDNKDTTVVQNLISITIGQNEAKLKLLRDNDFIDLGSIETEKKKTSLSSRVNRLAFCVDKFTPENEKSIIFANGPDDAEKIAYKLYDTIGRDIELDQSMKDLIDYVKKHLHKDFSLALMLKRGIAFHYGNLPTTIRLGIEDIFKNKDGQIRFLICTSTLLEGVNLPARNIFIENPKKGNSKEVVLSAHDFWNLAGRAGRLSKDLYGNVFLINYDNWQEALAHKKKDKELTSALYDTIFNHYDSIISYIEGEKDWVSPEEESATNKLFLEYKKNKLSIFLSASTQKLSDRQKDTLYKVLNELEQKGVELPYVILRKNPHISMLKQQRLYNELLEAYEKGEITKYLPVYPSDPLFSESLNFVIRQANKHLAAQTFNSGKFLNKVILFADKWIRGFPVSMMISDYISYKIKKNESIKINNVVRDILALVEKNIRFDCMIRVKCYIDILTYLLEIKKYNYEIPPIHLFMEMGACQQTRISLMGIGLSRPTAKELENLIADEDMSEEEAYKWLVDNFSTLEQRNITGLTLEEIKKFI